MKIEDDAVFGDILIGIVLVCYIILIGIAIFCHFLFPQTVPNDSEVKESPEEINDILLFTEDQIYSLKTLGKMGVRINDEEVYLLSAEDVERIYNIDLKEFLNEN